MSHDRRRPLQQTPITDPAERLELRLVTPAEAKPPVRLDTTRLAAALMERLRAGGFDCSIHDAQAEDGTPRTLH